MSHNSETGHGNPQGVATYLVEAAVALIGMAIGIIVIWGALEVGGAEWTADGPGAGYFPFYMGLIICGACAWIFIKAFINKNTEIFVENEGLKRVLSVLIPIIFYVAGVQLFGIYVAGSIYVFLFMRIMGKFSLAKSIIVPVGMSVFFFFMFEVWFLVPLEKGMFNLLGWTGY